MSYCYMLLDLILRMVIHGRKQVVQVVGENKFVHQIMMAKTVNTQSKTTLKHAGSISSIWYSSRLSFQINQNKFIVKECLFVL